MSRQSAWRLPAARPSEAPRLATVADAVGVHPAHLARTFRRRLGVTPGEYLRRLRLERAIALLASSDEPIADVAVGAGFYDQSHLTNALRNVTGLTPAELRRARRDAGGPIGKRMQNVSKTPGPTGS